MSAEAETERQTDERQEVLDRLPSRRPASLYDVAVQHAAIDWYVSVTSGEIDFDIEPKHLNFITPLAKKELYGEPDNALVANVDLTNPEDPKLDEDNPVELRTIDRGDRFRLGHSFPANKTNDTDHSITTHNSSSTPYRLSGLEEGWYTRGNLQDRFTRWAQSEEADEVVNEERTEDIWVIEALAELGNNDEEMKRIVEEFPMDPEDDDNEYELFVTVRVKLPGDSEYRYPGEVPALNEVMVAQKTSGLEDIPKGNVGGHGTGYVTNESGRVTGGSAGLLGMYTKKQREHFPDVPPSGESGWRSRPLTHETAAAIATANSLFEEFYRSLGEGRRLYVLPYIASHPESIDPATVDWFATEVFDKIRTAEQDEFEDEVEDLYRMVNDAAQGDEADEWAHEGESYADVRFATVFFVSGNPDRIYFESMSPEATYRPSELEDAHLRVLRENEYVGDGILSDLVRNSESSLLNSEATLRSMILFGGYFDRTTEPTANSEDASGQPKAGDIDDVRARRMRSLLTGETVSYDTLFEEYLHRIVQEQRSAFGDDSRRNVPSWAIAEQYTQLRALERSGVVGEKGSTKLDTETMTQQQESPVPEGGEYESRKERLNDFIETHPVLDDESKLAVFLLGGLVGRLSAYQRQNDVSSTLVRRYPVDYITKQSIKEVTAEVIEMNNTYIEADDETSSGMNARYTNRLPNLMLSADPSKWKFSQNEIQWLYALGITYGTNDTSVQQEE